jgi:hypothetical protein
MKKAMLGIMMIGDALFLDKPIYNYLRYIPCMHTMYTCVYIYTYSWRIRCLLPMFLKFDAPQRTGKTR